MATSTKEALAAALRHMMNVKPIGKITVKDLVEICGVNRQTFYYHFDDVYDLLEWVFEEDANRVLPHKVIYDHWREDMLIFMDYLQTNSVFTLNVYNSNSRIYMLRYLEEKMEACIRSFAVRQYRPAGFRVCCQVLRQVRHRPDCPLDGPGDAASQGDHDRTDPYCDGQQRGKHAGPL